MLQMDSSRHAEHDPDEALKMIQEEFAAGAGGLSPAEWVRRWEADLIEDTPESNTLTVFAYGLMDAGHGH